MGPGLGRQEFPGGVLELQTGEGRDQRTVKENYGPCSHVDGIFLNRTRNVGNALTVVTGEDDDTG